MTDDSRNIMGGNLGEQPPLVGHLSDLPDPTYRYARFINNCGPFEDVIKADGTIWNPNFDNLVETSWMEPVNVIKEWHCRKEHLFRPCLPDWWEGPRRHPLIDNHPTCGYRWYLDLEPSAGRPT